MYFTHCKCGIFWFAETGDAEAAPAFILLHERSWELSLTRAQHLQIVTGCARRQPAAIGELLKGLVKLNWTTTKNVKYFTVCWLSVPESEQWHNMKIMKMSHLCIVQSFIPSFRRQQHCRQCSPSLWLLSFSLFSVVLCKYLSGSHTK